ncbi:MAG: NUDIX hydrolase [Bdellovibrionales bacterium]
MKNSRPGVGVGVVVEKDGKILMIRRRHVHGDMTWSTPGGHLEMGESPEECGIREVFEETRVVVDRPNFLAITNDYFPETGRHSVTLWFRCHYKSGEATVGDPSEMDRVEWVDKANLPEALFSPLSNLLSGRSYPADSIDSIS